MAHFGKFRGRNFREKGKKTRNRESFFPRKFLPLKYGDIYGDLNMIFTKKNDYSGQLGRYKYDFSRIENEYDFKKAIKSD